MTPHPPAPRVEPELTSDRDRRLASLFLVARHHTRVVRQWSEDRGKDKPKRYMEARTLDLAQVRALLELEGWPRDLWPEAVQWIQRLWLWSRTGDPNGHRDLQRTVERDEALELEAVRDHARELGIHIEAQV